MNRHPAPVLQVATIYHRGSKIDIILCFEMMGTFVIVFFLNNNDYRCGPIGSGISFLLPKSTSLTDFPYYCSSVVFHKPLHVMAMFLIPHHHPEPGLQPDRRPSQ